MELHYLQESDISFLCNLYRYPVSLVQASVLYHQLQKTHSLAMFVDNRFVGIIEFFPVKEGTYEIGYRTCFQEQGKGFMKQGVGLCKKLCKEYGVKRLIARVVENNIASIRILEYNGFLQEVNNDGVLLYVYDC